MGKQCKQWQTLFWGAPKSQQMVTAAMKLKDTCSLEEKLWPTKVHLVRAMVFPVVIYGYEFSSVQSLSAVWFFVTPWSAACQASLSITNYQSLLKFMSIELVRPSNHLILCGPLLLPPQSFPDSGSFQMCQHFESGCQSTEVSASTSVLPMNIQDWFPLGWTGWISLHWRDSEESSPTPQFKSINSSALSFLYSPALTSTHNCWKNHSLCWESNVSVF